jgi:hypothetical protein
MAGLQASRFSLHSQLAGVLPWARVRLRAWPSRLAVRLAFA